MAIREVTKGSVEMSDKSSFGSDAIIRADDGTRLVPEPHISAVPNYESCSALHEQCSLGEPNLIEISRLASEHPYWKGLVLHLANSANFGLLQPVSRLNHAVAMLGARRIGRAVEHVLRDHHGYELDAPTTAQQTL